MLSWGDFECNNRRDFTQGWSNIKVKHEVTCSRPSWILTATLCVVCDLQACGWKFFKKCRCIRYSNIFTYINLIPLQNRLREWSCATDWHTLLLASVFLYINGRSWNKYMLYLVLPICSHLDSICLKYREYSFHPEIEIPTAESSYCL